MIPDLRGRLKAVAEKPKQREAPNPCQVLEERVPLSALGCVLDVTAADVRRMGLEVPNFDVRRALFLDTETTGLRGAGTVAFLIGVGWVEGEEFVVRQLLMQDYPEEAHQLEMLAEMLPRFDVAVTFNGKSFDVPLLRDRFTMARLRDRWRELHQLDLLHTARRVWRLRLGTCSLGELEEHVLGIARENDLPGAEVPERYFAYLKTGDRSLLEDVLRHNSQDIRTLAVLLARLKAVFDMPERQTSMMDVFSVGRALERCGEGELARRCFTVASVSALSERARVELALSYRRAQDFGQAAEAYRSMIARGEGGVDAYIRLAVLLEWRLKDRVGALEATEKALWRFSGRMDAEVIRALERRRSRLRRRLEKDRGGEGHGTV